MKRRFSIAQYPTIALCLTILLLWLLPNQVIAQQPDTPTDQGDFAIQATSAISSDDAETITSLLAQGMSPNQLDTDQDPIICYAVYFGANDIVKILIDSGANVNVAEPVLGSLLQLTVTNANKAAFDLIMTQNPDVLMTGPRVLGAQGYTAFGWALIMSLGNPSANMSYILRSLETAQAKAEGEPVSVLRHNEALINPFAIASLKSHQINSARSQAQTADYAKYFLFALINDDVIAVKHLLAKGMSPNQKGIDDRPLIFDAFYNAKYPILQTLLNAGADVNTVEFDTGTRSNDGCNLLMYAVLDKNKSLLDMILAAHPDLTQEDNDGSTALDYAVQEYKIHHNTATFKILNTLRDVGSPSGDNLKSYNAQDGDLIAKVTSFDVDGTSDIPTITGNVKNCGTHRYTYVEIDAKFKDSSGNLIDSSMDNVTSLDPGETWKFSISTLKDGATTYDLTGLKGHS
jgi:ankyrin repeat protein